MNKTGWPPGLLQDDDRKLAEWFASRINARYVIREVCKEIERQRKEKENGIKQNGRRAAA